MSRALICPDIGSIRIGSTLCDSTGRPAPHTGRKVDDRNLRMNLVRLISPCQAQLTDAKEATNQQQQASQRST
eukprot:450655-Hanusia_phi.AAC.1